MTDGLEKLREIVSLMNENDLTEIELTEEGTRIRVKKHDTRAQPTAFVAPPPIEQPQPTPAAPEQPPEAKSDLIEIPSPMVGTFYRATSPEAEPYVEVGSVVEEEAVVCIIEAMKVMNEIKAEVTGEIAKILVGNGDPVEYGQALFLVKPPEGA